MDILKQLCEPNDQNDQVQGQVDIARQSSPFNQSRYSEYSDTKLQDKIAQFS